MLWVKRTLVVLAGIVLLWSNLSSAPEGTFLGFFPFDSAERLGANMAHVALTVLALWIILRGFGIRLRRGLKEPAELTLTPATLVDLRR